jgi:hypothetical protein
MDDLDLNFKWVNRELEKFEVVDWLLDQPETLTMITHQEVDHVASCIMSIYNWRHDNMKMGHFCTALMRNDLVGAAGCADGTNKKALFLYAMFMYNVLPANWREWLKDE